MLKYDIFRYKEFAACNFLGGDTNSFEICIKDSDNYNLEFTSETFDGDFIESKMYKISKDSVDKIKNIINDNKEIFDVNSSLNNGSLDGAGQKFWFANEDRNREILAWNIDDSIDNGQEVRKEYLEEYGDNLRQERIVLKVFYQICEVLKTDGITLDLYNFVGNEKIQYKFDEEV